MPTSIALLRGINVGGHHRVPMAALRAMFEDLGYVEPETLLQTGNVIFEHGTGAASALETTFEAAAGEAFGFAPDVFVRSAKQWDALVRDNPFAAHATRQPGQVTALLLKRAPTAAAVKALQATITGPEQVRAGKKHAYVVYPDGIGRSKLTAAAIEKTLGSGTARNWNTVMKIQAAIEGR